MDSRICDGRIGFGRIGSEGIGLLGRVVAGEELPHQNRRCRAPSWQRCTHRGPRSPLAQLAQKSVQSGQTRCGGLCFIQERDRPILPAGAVEIPLIFVDSRSQRSTEADRDLLTVVKRMEDGVEQVCGRAAAYGTWLVVVMPTTAPGEIIR